MLILESNQLKTLIDGTPHQLDQGIAVLTLVVDSEHVTLPRQYDTHIVIHKAGIKGSFDGFVLHGILHLLFACIPLGNVHTRWEVQHELIVFDPVGAHGMPN